MKLVSVGTVSGGIRAVISLFETEIIYTGWEFPGIFILTSEGLELKP